MGESSGTTGSKSPGYFRVVQYARIELLFLDPTKFFCEPRGSLRVDRERGSTGQWPAQWFIQGRGSLLQLAADQSSNWSVNNLMKVNCDKSKELLVDFAKKPLCLSQYPYTGHRRTACQQHEAPGCHYIIGLVAGACELYTRQSSSASLLSHPAEEGLAATWQFDNGIHNHCQVCHGVRLPDVAYGFNRWAVRDLKEHSKACSGDHFPRSFLWWCFRQAGVVHLARQTPTLVSRFFQAMLQPEHRLHHLLLEKRDSGYGLRNSKKYP